MASTFYPRHRPVCSLKPKSEDFALDQAAPGYRVLHLQQNGEFDTYIERVALSQQNINTEISGY